MTPTFTLVQDLRYSIKVAKARIVESKADLSVAQRELRERKLGLKCLERALVQAEQKEA